MPNSYGKNRRDGRDFRPCRTGQVASHDGFSLPEDREKQSSPSLDITSKRLWHAARVFGVNLGHMWDEIDRLREWGEALMGLAAGGVIRPKVAASFKFDDAPQAHHFIQDRRNIGKVLLVP